MSDILKYGNAIRLAQLASDPSGAENGTLYYNTTDQVVKQYINGVWEEAPTAALVQTKEVLASNFVSFSGTGSGLADGVISVADTSGLALNMLVVGSGIPTGQDCYISAIVTNTSVTITSPLGFSVTVPASPATFYAVSPLKLDTDNAPANYQSGSVRITSGTSTVSSSGSVVINTGNTSTSGVNSGNIFISPGAATGGGGAVRGSVYINGSNIYAIPKITANGGIDLLDLSSTKQKIINMADPTSTYDGANKNYVDTGLSAKQDTSAKGQPNGYASLDGSGKVPVAQLPNAIMEYQGTWDASTNTPTLADGAGSIGDVYRVSVAGTQNLGSGAITFGVGDYAILNASLVWEKADTTDAVSSVNSLTGAVVLDTDDIGEGVTNLYFTDERAQDAVGTILTDSGSVDFTYNDAGNTITAAVIPGGVDHDQLLNYSANKHVDHTTVSIATAANTSGLTGGGDISATRNLSVDINGTTAETVADNADKVLIYDNSAGALKSMTRANFLSGIAVSSAGDINESSYTGLANNTANQNVTGLAFANGTVRSFKAQLSIVVNATANSYATYELMGIQRGADWQMSESFTGDSITGLTFNITNAGQVQASIGNISGFSSATIKFRASTTSV